MLVTLKEILEIAEEKKIAVVPYVIPGKYVAYAFSYTGGALIQWCVDTLVKKEKEEAKALGIKPGEKKRYEVSVRIESKV